LLSHENNDIVVDAVNVLKELISFESEGHRKLIEALVQLDVFEALLAGLNKL